MKYSSLLAIEKLKISTNIIPHFFNISPTKKYAISQKYGL
jgi:hypothetical protein